MTTTAIAINILCLFITVLITQHDLLAYILSVFCLFVCLFVFSPMKVFLSQCLYYPWAFHLIQVGPRLNSRDSLATKWLTGMDFFSSDLNAGEYLKCCNIEMKTQPKY